MKLFVVFVENWRSREDNFHAGARFEMCGVMTCTVAC